MDRYHIISDGKIIGSAATEKAAITMELKGSQEGAKQGRLRYAAPQGGYVLFLVKV